MTVEELRLQKEKVRVFELARELDMESKDLMALCRQHGIELKNQLSTVGPEQRDQIVELAKRGPASPPAQRLPTTPVIPTNLPRKIQNLESRPRGPKPPTPPAPAPAPARPPEPAAAPVQAAPPPPAPVAP